MITGGRGFVGGWLAAHLREDGDDVNLIDRETDVADPAQIGPRLADAAPDAIYHLAALTHVGESWNAPSEPSGLMGARSMVATSCGVHEAPVVPPKT